MMRLITITTAIILSLTGVVAQASYVQRQDVQTFINDMVKKHGFDQELLTYWMKDIKQQTTALEAIARPAERKPWKEYQPIFLTSKRIKQGVEFWKQHQDTLAKAEKQFGVPAEIIVAIIGVETFYGQRSGSYPVLDALATLGFDYPPRSDFFLRELEQYLLMSREENIDPRALKGSYAGAMGMPQFISSSFRNYAIDFDGDGKRDLWNSTADAIGSVANYFNRHGWRRGDPIITPAKVANVSEDVGDKQMKPYKPVAEFKRMGVKPEAGFSDAEQATLLKLDGADGFEYWMGLNNFYVITRYNHSPLYALAVFQLSQAVASE
ncbi:MAG: lytic murein transglycosylase B, partial [Gammaproteobacteria bacterium]